MPERRPTTRFQHSAGVMALLARLGAPLEEQVAGLLHDVPHTAFSHTVDVLYPSEEHNYHERYHAEVVMKSDIPDILARNHVPLAAALQPELYPHLEQPLPDLCADRLDYAFRDALALGKIRSHEALAFISHLVPGVVPLIVDSSDAAAWFARLFEELNDEVWTNPDDAGAYWALAGAMRRAISLGDMSESDLFLDDELAMSRLRASPDRKVQAYLSLLTPGRRFYKREGEGPFFVIRMKSRMVDPLVLEPGMSAPARLSRISHECETHLARRPAGKSVTYRLWSDGMESILPRDR
jgi:HD superfamily phosphohydrolase